MARPTESGKTKLPDFERALQHVPIAILIVDSAGRIIFSNSRFHEQTGQTPVANEPLAKVFSGSAKSLLEKLVAAGQGNLLELSLRDDDSAGAIGILFDVELLVSEEGAFRHYLLTEHTTEQTTSSYTELDATRSMEEADRMREQKSKLQESYDRLERFSYGAAHDLRAPLRNISSLLDYVEEDYGQAIPKEAHGLLDTARQSARRLQALVSDLLTHARAGAEAINLEDVALKPMIKNVEKTFSEAMTAAGATIHLRCRDDTLKADPLLLRQLLENIIGNAIKYRNPNRPLRIDISLSGSGSGERSLSVRDNGIGFEPGFAEQIFEPFQRLHSTQEIEGSGVGLATVRTICKRMNWRASATGVLGEGAEFTFSGVF